MDSNQTIVKGREKKINNNRTKKRKTGGKTQCLLTSSNLKTKKAIKAKTNAHFVNFHFKIGKKGNERKNRIQNQNRIASYLRTTIGICDNFSSMKKGCT